MTLQHSPAGPSRICYAFVAPTRSTTPGLLSDAMSLVRACGDVGGFAAPQLPLSALSS